MRINNVFNSRNQFNIIIHMRYFVIYYNLLIFRHVEIWQRLNSITRATAKRNMPRFTLSTRSLYLDLTSCLRGHKLCWIESMLGQTYIFKTKLICKYFLFFFAKKWCRSGICVLKTDTFEKYTTISKLTQSESDGGNTNVIDDRKFGNLMKSEQRINRLNLVRDEIIKFLLSMNDIVSFLNTIDFNVERVDQTQWLWIRMFVWWIRPATWRQFWIKNFLANLSWLSVTNLKLLINIYSFWLYFHKIMNK